MFLEMKNITKCFDATKALDDVSFSCEKGEIRGLLGENGAGKSTLMSILFGMYEPDEGEVYIRGKKVEVFSPNHATAMNIGMVHQHFMLVENFTVTQNIILGMETVKGAGMLDMKRARKEVEDLSLIHI